MLIPGPDANGNVNDPFVDLKKDKLRIQTGSMTRIRKPRSIPMI